MPASRKDRVCGRAPIYLVHRSHLQLQFRRFRSSYIACYQYIQQQVIRIANLRFWAQFCTQVAVNLHSLLVSSLDMYHINVCAEQWSDSSLARVHTHGDASKDTSDFDSFQSLSMIAIDMGRLEQQRTCHPAWQSRLVHHIGKESQFGAFDHRAQRLSFICINNAKTKGCRSCMVYLVSLGDEWLVYRRMCIGCEWAAWCFQRHIALEDSEWVLQFFLGRPPLPWFGHRPSTGKMQSSYRAQWEMHGSSNPWWSPTDPHLPIAHV